ncbi:MAG TPA: SRPBCC family protein [Burkholderiales bacterium]
MNQPTVLLVGTALGAAAMYLFDPERGRRRRALVRDQLVHSGHKLQDAAQSTAADVRNRAEGYASTLRSASRRLPPSDDVLAERVRTAIGRACSHPRAIEVTASSGTVTLSGPVLAREIPLLIDRVLAVRGVQNVVNRLQPETEPGSIPALQGEGRTGAGKSRLMFMRQQWPPAARAVGSVAGGALALYGFGAGGALNKALGLGGVALLARAATNMELRRLIGIGAGRRAVTVHKTIRINAPVERVFEAWSNAENFPQFITHVREVRPLGGERESRRWHWRVRGSSGMEFDFETRTTAYEENRFIAWRTEPGALIQHAGQVRFAGNPDGSTSAEVTLSYNPVAGAVGHVIAKLLGDDAKRQLDDDLMRMKTYLETGMRPHDAAVQPAQVAPAPPGQPTPRPGL